MSLLWLRSDPRPSSVSEPWAEPKKKKEERKQEALAVATRAAAARCPGEPLRPRHDPGRQPPHLRPPHTAGLAGSSRAGGSRAAPVGTGSALPLPWKKPLTPGHADDTQAATEPGTRRGGRSGTRSEGQPGPRPRLGRPSPAAAGPGGRAGVLLET